MRVIPGADVADVADLAVLSGEVMRLRTALVEERVSSVRALARATRLSQLVTALGQVVDVSEVFERAVCEVAELFGADVAAVLTPVEDGGSTSSGGVSGAGDGSWRLIASWGLGAAAPDLCAPLGCANRPTPASPVVAGAAGDFEIPDWLRAYQPVHLTWGLLTVRDEQPGYLLLIRRADQPFDNADAQELAAVVSRIALAVDNGRLYQRTQEQLRHSQLLHEVTAALAGCPDPDAVADRLAEAVAAHVPVVRAVVRRTPAAGPEAPDELVLPLGGDSPGALVVTGPPEPGSGSRDFLQHLADVGGLAMDKALLFARLRRQAETDALTGLPNRALFHQRLATALDRCRAEGTELAVLFIDLDGFKAVNDTHGHDAGDRLLIEVAARLTAATGPAGFCARLGGDEFVVLLDGDEFVSPLGGDEFVSRPDGDEVVGRLGGDSGPARGDTGPARFRRVMDEPFELDGPAGPVRLRAGGSIGAATTATCGYDAGALLREADAAMYAAKRDRRTGARRTGD